MADTNRLRTSAHVRANLTPDQYRSILEHLACRAHTLRGVLMQLQCSSSDSSCEDGGVLIDAAEALATSIGAMADGASGGRIHGNADWWYFGPLFAELGKAGAA